MTKMDNNWRRPASQISPPPVDTSKPIKRPRLNAEIDKLSDRQKSIVAEAAAILHVPIKSVPGAISRLQTPSGSLGEIRRRHRKSSQRAMGGQSEGSKTMTPIHDVFYSGVNSEPPVLKEDPHINEPNASPVLCATDSCFGFELRPDKWAACLASFSSVAESSSFETENSNTFLNSNSYRTEEATVSQSLFLQQPPYLTDGYAFDHSLQMAPMVEQTRVDNFFACDFLASSQGLSNYPVLSPTQLQMVQPKAAKPEMAYLAVETSINADIWNQNTVSSIMNSQDYYSVHDTQAQLAESNIELEQSVWFSDEGQESQNLASAERLVSVRRGPFRNLKDRAQTAHTRKLAACVRCRMQRIRCVYDPLDPQGVCLTCKKVSNLKLAKLPCLRYKITEVKLFKSGPVPGCEWTRRWSNKALDDISTWSSKDIKTIQVTEGYGARPLILHVSEFVPAEGDMLERHWVAGGMRRSAKIPPYAIVDLAIAEQNVKDYINQGGAEFFKSALDYKDKLLWGTYSIAIETANNPETAELERKLLKMVLRLWVSIRIGTRSSRILGNETLGMSSNILDETSPIHGHIPIPPVMGAQIELILTQRIQVPLRVQVLDLLQKIILANKVTSWFTIYLCTFILLHNCAMITKHDAGYARKHGIQARFARPAMVAEYHMGANILLAYFHYCNKGDHPFNPDKSIGDFARNAGLNDKQKQFVELTRSYVTANKQRFEELRWQGAFENDHYFVAQLYDQTWSPRITV